MMSKPTGMPTGRPLSAAKIKTLNGEQEYTMPPFPTGFNAYQKTVWGLIFSEENRHIKGAQDLLLAEQLCLNLLLSRRIAAEIKAGTLTIEINGGNTTILNPLISHLPKLQAQIQSQLGALGFSPLDRAKLGLIEAETDSEIVSFMKENGK